MNVEQCQCLAASEPQTEPTALGCESACRLLLSLLTIAVYYYWDGKLILPSHWKLSSSY